MGISIGNTDKFLYFLTNEGAFSIPQDSIRWILNQYTGLKDKNGKEIYENDLIKILPEGDVRQISYSEFKGFFVDEKRSGHDELSPYQWHEKAEVIGNIHEHENLLK